MPGAPPLAAPPVVTPVASPPAEPPDDEDDDGQRRLLSPIALVGSLLLSAGTIALISFGTRLDVTDLRLFWERLHGGVLTLALGALGLRVLFGGWRLYWIGAGRLSFAQGVRGQLAWDFFSLVTPALVGGGPFTAVYVARDRGMAVGEGTALLLYAMLLEQCWTALSVLVLLVALPFAPVFPAALPPWGVAALAGYFVCILLWALTVGFAMLYRPAWLEAAVRWAGRRRGLRRFEARLTREASQLRRRAEVLRGRGAGFFAGGFALTALTWTARYATLALIVRSVVPDLDLGLFGLRAIATTVGAFVLPTPGGAGGIEGLYALFLGPLIHPPALIAPTLIVWRTLAYYLFLGFGLVLTWQGVRRAARAAPEPAA